MSKQDVPWLEGEAAEKHRARLEKNACAEISTEDLEGGWMPMPNADSRRIVASGNACLKIPVEALEAGVIQDVFNAAKDALDFVQCVCGDDSSSCHACRLERAVTQAKWEE